MMHDRFSEKARRLVAGFAIFLSLGGLPSHEASAEIYKFVKDGVVHYSDRPPELRVSYSTIEKTNGGGSTVSTTRRVTQGSSSFSAPQYGEIITRVASQYGISAELVNAVIKVESNFNADAVSPKGAQGLMQLMPGTAKRFGVTDSFDPEQNITGGVKYLQLLFKEFGEANLDLVLAGYNAGEQAVKKYNNQIPPYSETRNYVKKVMALYTPGAALTPYKSTGNSNIYRYVNPDGTIMFTNVPRVR